jgi:hypothetical protein
VGSCLKKILINGTNSLKTPDAPEGEDWDEEGVANEMKKLFDNYPYTPLLSPI